MSYRFKKTITALLCLPLLNGAVAQNYAVSNIPEILKKNAHAVIRNEATHIIIKDLNKAVVQEKMAVTVLDEDGISDGAFFSIYSSLSSLNDIEGTLYDAQGNKIKTMKKKDVQDRTLNGDESLITDTRYKIHNFYWSQYPYTVEYTYERELKSLFILPYWDPASYNVSIEHAELTVDAPSNYTVRLKGINLPAPLPAVQDNGKTKTFSYSINNQKAEDYEVLSNKGILNGFPKILIAPSDLTMGKYTGNMSDWKRYGQFIYALYKDKDRLPDNVKQDVHRLTDNLKDTREKANILYKYMQNSTRYIGVQLGIGGWEPFDAYYVGTKKYGDCKALSNYMYSLLKEAGISSDPVLISAGENNTNYLVDDFSNSYFNHVILCIPQPKDTIWLECTSQSAPFGYLGAFTANRKALLLSPDGGYIVNTPNYSPAQNLQKRIVTGAIDEEGNLKAGVNTFYQGEQQDDIASLLHDNSKDVLKKYLNRSFGLDTYEVIASNYKETSSEMPSVEEKLEISAPNYASIVGKRIMFKPNAFNKSSTKLDTSTARRSEIVFTYPFSDYDSTVFTVPSGYDMENLPKPLSLESVFGKYSISFDYRDGKVICVRSQQREAGTFSPSQYNAMAAYFDKIYKADRESIVLRKKDN